MIKRPTTLGRRFGIIVVASALLLVPGHLSAQSDTERNDAATPVTVSCGTATGHIAYIPFDQDGDRLAGLAVLDPTTGKAATLDLPVLESIAPLRTPGLVLVSAVDSGDRFVVDTRTGDSVEVALPPDITVINPAYSTFPTTSVPANGIEIVSNGETLYTLDTASGQLVDLRGLLGPDVLPSPLSYQFAPDGARFIVTDFDRTWILDTVASPEPRVLSEGHTVVGGRFSPDGSMLTYVDRGEDIESGTLRVEPADGSAAPTVLATGAFFSAQFMPDGKRVLASRVVDIGGQKFMHFVAVDIESGAEDLLYVMQPAGASLYVDPNGGGMVIADSSSSTFIYTHVNFDTGAATVLSDITGHQFVSASNVPYGLAMPPSFPGDEIAPQPGVFTVDLATGDDTLITPVDVENHEFASVAFMSRDGRYALADLFSDTGSRMIIVQLATGESVEVPNATGSLSPDGCFAAAAVRPDDDAGGAPEIIIVSTKSGEQQSIGNGTFPVWAE